MRYFRAGRNRFLVRVIGGVLRHNRGDAEWYLYTKLRALGKTGPGELAVNDLVWPRAMFVSGTGEISMSSATGCWVEYRYEFEIGLPQDTANPSPAYTAPAEPAEYEGRSNAGSFIYNGINLGDAPAYLVPRVRREVLAREIPRCFGVRYKNIKHGREIKLVVRCILHRETRAALEDVLRDTAYDLGDGAATLTGNGNTYPNCYITELHSAGHDAKFDEFTVTFVQEADET